MQSSKGPARGGHEGRRGGERGMAWDGVCAWRVRVAPTARGLGAGTNAPQAQAVAGDASVARRRAAGGLTHVRQGSCLPVGSACE